MFLRHNLFNKKKVWNRIVMKNRKLNNGFYGRNKNKQLSRIIDELLTVMGEGGCDSSALIFSSEQSCTKLSSDQGAALAVSC